MKVLYRSLFIALFLCSVEIHAKEVTDSGMAPVKDPAALIGNEVNRLDLLIQATQQSLEGEKKLREQIVEYKKIQDQHLRQPENNDILYRLVKSAHRTLESIKAHHLTQTFDPDFINELTVISQPIAKRGIPKAG